MELVAPRRLDVVETAKLIREKLKQAFPGIKFKVRSSKFSGGTAVDITWIDGPFVKDVEAIANRYASGDFNGMDDSYSYRDDTLMAYENGTYGNVSFGAKYVDTHRELSDAYKAQLAVTAAHLVTTQSTYEWSMDGYYPVSFYHKDGYGMMPSHSTGHEICWRLSQHIAPQA